MRASLPLDPPGLAWRVLRTTWLVVRLRCPACGLGRLSDGFFRLKARCEACGVTFERSPGEFTGGMGLNSVATCAGVAALSLWVGLSDVPLAIGLSLVAAFAAVFPILFYRHSRALWVGILHVSGMVHRDEAADPEPVIRPWPPDPGPGGAPPSAPGPTPGSRVSSCLAPGRTAAPPPPRRAGHPPGTGAARRP